MTTAPDYLLKSSPLTKTDERITEKNDTSLHQKELLECKGLTGAAQLEDGSGIKLEKMENAQLKLQLASSLTENRLLSQLSAACLTTRSTLQLSQLGMKPSSHVDSTDVSQKMSQLCVASSRTLSSKEKFSGTYATPVLSSVPVGTKSTVAVPEPVMKKHARDRKAVDSKGTSAAGKPKQKPVKKVKFGVPEEGDNAEDVACFELPNYQLVHERVDTEKVELFLPPEREELAEQLMRPLVDVQSIKVVILLLYCYILLSGSCVSWPGMIKFVVISVTTLCIEK